MRFIFLDLDDTILDTALEFLQAKADSIRNEGE